MTQAALARRRSPIHNILGPELYWVLVYLVAWWFTRQNLPPTEAGSRFLEKLGWLLPLIAVPASFFLYALPVPPRWLTARLVLATIIGLNVVVFKLIGGIDYGDSRNSGVLGVWVMGFLAGLVGFVAAMILRWILR
jgi:hypothetical protein